MAVILKKNDKILTVIAALPAGYSPDDFIAKFIEMHPRDWQRIQSEYRAHEKATKPGKSHPMPEPHQYLQNALKVYLNKT